MQLGAEENSHQSILGLVHPSCLADIETVVIQPDQNFGEQLAALQLSSCDLIIGRKLVDESPGNLYFGKSTSLDPAVFKALNQLMVRQKISEKVKLDNLEAKNLSLSGEVLSPLTQFTLPGVWRESLSPCSRTYSGEMLKRRFPSPPPSFDGEMSIVSILTTLTTLLSVLAIGRCMPIIRNRRLSQQIKGIGIIVGAPVMVHLVGSFVVRNFCLF